MRTPAPDGSFKAYVSFLTHLHLSKPQSYMFKQMRCFQLPPSLITIFPSSILDPLLSLFLVPSHHPRLTPPPFQNRSLHLPQNRHLGPHPLPPRTPTVSRSSQHPRDRIRGHVIAGAATGPGRADRISREQGCTHGLVYQEFRVSPRHQDGIFFLLNLRDFDTEDYSGPVNHLLQKFLPGKTFAPVVTREFRPPKPDPAGILHIAKEWGLDDRGESLIMVSA